MKEIASLDTGPLQPKQLSDREWQIVFEIERRLAEPLPSELNRELVRRRRNREFNPPHLAQADSRYQRVLLLDGGRGTGKTSVLLTLIKRWHGAADAGDSWELDDADKVRINQLRNEDARIPHDGAVPTNIRVISNLDFDSLPREMPLVAGIVQAWRPIVEHYDEVAYPRDELSSSDDNRRLMDLWHSLFRVAAVGWSDVSKTKGLIEQVLDREEQVRDWQHLREQWVWFVDHVIRVGRSLQSDDPLGDDPVFVIVIDDVDLQVERIRELLPALRLLTHPNVYFLVAADRDHMLEMLRLDFLGQQRRLIRESQSPEPSFVDIERWAKELARSAFEKVFPRRNCWTLRKLTLSDFLSYPRHIVTASAESRDASKSTARRNALLDANFRTLLNLMRSGRRGAGDALSELAIAAADAAVELPVMSYRTAQQLRHAVLGLNQPAPRVAVILTQLVSAAGEFDVRATPAGIEVLAVGELGAFYRPTLVESGGYNTVVSGRPRFTFIEHGKEARLWGPDGSEELTAGLVAKALQEQGFAIDATGLKWETFLSFAWTEWPKLNASFAWSRHKHPRPDEMFAQTREWSEFLQSVIETRRKLERFAYAWIYYQRKWSGHRLDAALDPVQTKNRDARLDWAGVLDFPQLKTGAEVSDDVKKWKEETLPLLARPELGFPPDIQSRLLVHVKEASDAVKIELKRQRRRLATDALFAAGLQRGDVNRMAEDDEVERVIDSIDKAYASLHPKPSPWRMIEAIPDVVEPDEQDND